MNITALIEDFATQVMAATQAATAQRVQAALAAVFGARQKRGPGRPPKAVAAVAPVAGRKATSMTPKLARARKLQGQYLGVLRGLAAGDRAKVKAVAKAKGAAAAVKMARGMKKA